MRRLRDASLLAATILMGPLSRLAVRPLGDEGRRPLPGDEIEPDAMGQWTNAISIRARPADIWPWLVQMGCGRAGWYSYDGLDNGGQPSAERIVPELQEIEVGDVFPWTPNGSRRLRRPRRRARASAGARRHTAALPDDLGVRARAGRRGDDGAHCASAACRETP